MCFAGQGKGGYSKKRNTTIGSNRFLNLRRSVRDRQEPLRPREGQQTVFTKGIRYLAIVIQRNERFYLPPVEEIRELRSPPNTMGSAKEHCYYCERAEHPIAIKIQLATCFSRKDTLHSQATSNIYHRSIPSPIDCVHNEL